LSEGTLKRLALESGVEIRTGVHVESLDALEEAFPAARFLIGADGRRSVMRAQRFGDRLCQDYSVMRIMFCKYEVQGETSSLAWGDYISLSQQHVQHSVVEIVGRMHDGVTAVTLQVFVNRVEFEDLQGYTAKEPASILEVSNLSPALGNTLQLWVQKRVSTFREQMVEPPRINAVPLDVYEASAVVKRAEDGRRVWALVGDAAFGVPFFRALNDGFLCATSLSQAVAEEHSSSTGGSPYALERYEHYFKSLTRREKVAIAGKAGIIRAGLGVKSSTRTVVQAKKAFWGGVLSKVGPAFGFSGPRTAKPDGGRCATTTKCVACGRGSGQAGCVHRGRWHDSFSDCGPRCAWGLGPARLGMAHYDCCYGTEQVSYCLKSEHIMPPPPESETALQEQDDDLFDLLSGAMAEESAEAEGEEAEVIHAGEIGESEPLYASEYYSAYYGHAISYLETVNKRLRHRGGKANIVWLAGDSTMDNKYWIDESLPAANGYERIFDPAGDSMCKPDVAYWVNHELMAKNASNWACINCAREEHTLSKGLNPQDHFLQENIQANDVLVCCIGGNDIALAPSATTVAKMLWVTNFANRENIANGTAAGLGHFFDLFGAQTQSYIQQLVSRTRPRCVVVCMLYYLDETPDETAWANNVLQLLGYNRDPTVLQSLIQACYAPLTNLPPSLYGNYVHIW